MWRMSEMTGYQPVVMAWGGVLCWLALALLAIPLRIHKRWLLVGFPLAALVGLWMIAVGVTGLLLPASAQIVPVGFPGLPVHLRLDALSGFFLLLLGMSAFGVSVYARGYFQHMEIGELARLAIWYPVFLAAMALVLLANDAYAFMVAWELMALSSYFLVVSDYRVEEIRKAGFLYLLMAHIGAVALLLCFGVLQGNGHTGDAAFTFSAMRHGVLTSTQASLAFLFALIGFGAKAGLVPLHVWLPEAHPAAPSPVSALMSGVMLKMALYGLLRIGFDLLSVRQEWWGVLVLVLGLMTALYGVIFAAVQSDIKRLLAWSSIENVGLIFTGLGLAIIFSVEGKGGLAALALTAVLYHALNHALFKSLLFVGTGSVLHASGTRLMSGLGGLMRKMPWTGWLMLLGVLAIAGLPPLNGFVSEWLLLQAFLFTPGLNLHYLNMMLPVATASIALVIALAAYVMVKFYGVIFLGQPRNPALKHAHETGIWQRMGMLWLASACVLLGLLPSAVIVLISPAVQQLAGRVLTNDGGWLVLAPMDAARASYAPLPFWLAILAVLLLVYGLVRFRYTDRLRRSAAWQCGFPAVTARMQDSAEGFGQPIQHIFSSFMQVERQFPQPQDRTPHYASASIDQWWHFLYLPIVAAVNWLSRQAARLQHGRIQWYLTYSFITLLVLLVFVQ